MATVVSISPGLDHQLDQDGGMDEVMEGAHRAAERVVRKLWKLFGVEREGVRGGYLRR